MSFGPGDTLTLQMRTPHGHYLWVTRSDDVSYLVVYPPQGHLKPDYSLIPSDEFSRTPTIRLPYNLKAVPYVYGRDTTLEPIFSAPGKYLVEVGDNFATDGGAPAPNCKLTFISRGKK